MKNKKLTVRILAGAMVALMFFGVVAGLLVYLIWRVEKQGRSPGFLRLKKQVKNIKRRGFDAAYERAFLPRLFYLWCFFVCCIFYLLRGFFKRFLKRVFYDFSGGFLGASTCFYATDFDGFSGRFFNVFFWLFSCVFLQVDFGSFFCNFICGF